MGKDKSSYLLRFSNNIFIPISPFTRNYGMVAPDAERETTASVTYAITGP